MNAQVLFENADFKITHRNTRSDLLVVAFSPMHWPEQRTLGRHWADTVAGKVPFSWLSIDAKTAHWYCDAKWKPVANLIAEVAARYKLRVGYGHSMGAYGALKRSRDYSPCAVLAFAPQWSIEPARVGDFDVRYARVFDGRFHQGMEIKPYDITARSWIFFDPNFSDDHEHAQRITGSNVSYVHVTQMRHDVIRAAMGSVTLTYLVMRAVLGGVGATGEIRRIVQRGRRKTSIYLVQLARKATSRGHAQWGFSIAARALASNSQDGAAFVCYLQACSGLGQSGAAQRLMEETGIPSLTDGELLGAARALAELGLGKHAAELLDKSSIADGENVRNLRIYAEVLISLGQPSQAIQLLSKAVAIAPEDPHCLAHLARVLMKSSSHDQHDLANAVRLLSRATTLDPSVSGFWKSYAYALERHGDVRGAVDAWLVLEGISQIGDKDRQRFDRLRKIANVASMPS
ncbi:tetratricopeptide repeat protein [Cupriavidus gilardii]|uniref:Tetratricopeptide repeat protein n=1 Tax=Cupriavidus gilardii TaxID=82541 RepID=A0A849BG54_9BURK|nr:tetratricopeptide repeat protein [Cupriavidus gilardii]KAB0593917.1 tetratricopeptide repeat protein [Cupriavidus gilardii]MCT9012434.1 tetratricopeptide repeat protein [Cupriavidus gilardii]MCT9054400.1 tetratricopeptide repeat protein [Cupriavidus gilardii]NNH13316.1 tetratricopeptide repeat protein [Cupriavidus gilardii]WNG71265.1 tetratricopeptide repeat protein [Cupriavidus gilardii]